LDFKKAFDKVELNLILEMMQRKGFSVKWVSSVTSILFRYITVLLNGVPGKTIEGPEKSTRGG
jgi:hypothetical protein